MGSPVKAQEQNILLVCLDAYIPNDPADSIARQKWAGRKFDDVSDQIWAETCEGGVACGHRWHVWRSGGVDYGHVLMGKTKPGTALVAGQDVKIVRRTQVEWCAKNVTTSCEPCFPGDGQRVEDVCRKCDPRAGDTCTKTECAVDQNDRSFCTDVPNASGGDIYKVFERSAGTIKPEADGSLTVPHIQSYTRVGAIHRLLAVQFLSGNTGSQSEALTNALKLATFTPEAIPEEGAADCVTVYWDPYGRIIDTKTLEPIKSVDVLLRNLDQNGKIIKTEVPGNPFFQNPFKTRADGIFTFAVNPGTYFLLPTHRDFIFPIDEQLVSDTVARLLQFDPRGEYVDTNKIYRDITEPIQEKAGKAERRDILMQPKNENYAGSVAEVVYADLTKSGSNQIVDGIASHPKSIVKASVNGRIVAQTQADLRGIFKLSIPSSLLTNENDSVALSVEKVPIGQLQSVPESQPPYLLASVPNYVGGYAFNTKMQTVPNAQVDVVVPSMGNLVYSTVKADNNGYVYISQNKIPPYGFTLKIKDGRSGQPLEQTLAQFKKANSVYFAETGNNLYSQQHTPPSENVLSKVRTDTPKLVASRDAFTFRSQGNPSSAREGGAVTETAQGSTNLGFVLVFFLIIGAAVGIIVLVGKMRQGSKMTY